jgi:formamidopyrimidine-DNA glycosylase
MPELPEVETVVRSLRTSLVGATFGPVLHCRSDMVRASVDLVHLLPGRRILAIDRRAKKILIRLSGPATLGVHLGMTGQLTVEPADTPLKPHTHLVIALGPTQLRFRDVRRFGEIWWLNDHSPDDANLGPEPLTLTRPQLAGILARTRRAIKTALLDQHLIAGLGNIYADESLFRAGIDPRTIARRLSDPQVVRLCRAIRQILASAIAHQGSSLRDYIMVNGQSGRFQNLHRVYGRSGQPCHKCQTAIRRIVMGGRSTCWCPKCQPRGRK